jgi:hypothetical protein
MVEGRKCPYCGAFYEIALGQWFPDLSDPGGGAVLVHAFCLRCPWRNTVWNHIPSEFSRAMKNPPNTHDVAG